MVEPVIITGALVWLAKEIVSQGIRWLLDQASNPPGPPARLPRAGAGQQGLAPIRRFDLSGGAGVTSHADITVRFADAPGQRLPVVLAFQEYGGAGSGQPFPMVLTDTAHVTLRRADYLITALVLWLPHEPGVKPMLRGVGWQRRWIAGNATESVAVGTRAPTRELVTRLGLVDKNGKALFSLPAATPKALPAKPAASPFTTGPGAPATRPTRRTSTGADAPWKPLAKPGRPASTPRPTTPVGEAMLKWLAEQAEAASATPPAKPKPVTPSSERLRRLLAEQGRATPASNACVARGITGARCRNPGVPRGGYRLCALHAAKALSGQPVQHHLSGQPITLRR